MIPKLNELLTKKTTLLLGAGASFDYGFPLWSGLKSKLIQLLENSQAYGIVPNDGTIWWKDRLENMSEDETVDKVATEAPEEHYDLFRQLISIAIIEYEQIDVAENKTGWIEELADKFSQVLIEQYPDSNLIESTITNFKVITLNYDRVFDIRFNPLVEESFKSVLTKPREFEKVFKSIFTKFGSIYHPHGCLGPIQGIRIDCNTYMNPNNAFGIPYGRPDHLKNSFRNGNIPFVLPVDDLVDAENNTYNRANTILEQSENVICIGLSPLGLNLSNLDMTKIRNVYYSGKEAVAMNFIPLNKYAQEIVNEL